MRLTLSGVAIAMIAPLFAARHSGACNAGRLPGDLVAFLRQHIVGDAPRVDWQAVVVEHAAQLRLTIRRELQLHELKELRIAVLFDDIHTLVRVDERLQLGGEGIRSKPEIGSLDVSLLAKLVAALANRSVG